ncbi:hypothetical protein N7492_009710 [Penicillium capsulatum]|uniref:Uncharacterized protein n=1 Tax=Penicillium capsulatum TaxID=69766 RepID=A0A9W9HPD4_9EURO|nr:hypothetical protein N7492_009710 [Penicillium capsulatum]KAJ6114210.1 hypothetical protein N7512_007655 [Penicillium capsulatum]
MLNLNIILEATDVLTTLSDTDIGVLLHYEGKLVDALQALQRTVRAVQAVRIETVGSGGTATVSPDSSFSNPASTLQPAEIAAGNKNTHSEVPTSPSGSDNRSPNYTTDGTETEPSSDDKEKSQWPKVVALCSHLNNKERSAAIKEYLSCTPDFGEMCAWKSGDPRITEIAICSSPGNCYDACLRRGLSQRSLAVEFDEWERATHDKSRVRELSEDLKARLKRTGHLETFIQARFKNNEAEAAQVAISHGLKWLVFESIYGHNGVSLVLMLVFSRFRDVKYEDLPQLKKELKDWEDFAIGKSSCLEEWQSSYEGKSSYTKCGLVSDPYAT